MSLNLSANNVSLLYSDVDTPQRCHSTMLKILTESEILTELYLSFLGEPCMFTILKVSGEEYRINEDTLKNYLPTKVAMVMEKIAALSSNVLIIEIWRKKNLLLQRDQLQPIDIITKAINEAILDDYNIYLKLADDIRIKHMLSKEAYTLYDAINFALQWYKRIRYMRSIISMISKSTDDGRKQNEDGMRIMNVLVERWTLSCMKDWEYGFLEHLLRRSSEVLTHIFNNWILDGHLDENINWMIKLEIYMNPKTTRHASLGTSFNSTSSVMELDFDRSELEVNNPLTGDKTSQLSGLKIPVKIVEHLTPYVFKDCNELVDLIKGIGEMVHFLKVLRCSRIYEHKLDERRQILKQHCSFDDIWYNSANRAHFCIAIKKLHDIVCENMMCELMQKQRLADHFTMIHSYFFMLRGDLVAELERSILANFVKSTLFYHTPTSVRKRSSNSLKLAEQFLNEALGKCSPPSNVADLMQMLSADKTSKSRSKLFYEAFSLTYDSKPKMVDDSMVPSPMGEFMPRELNKIYKKVFTILANLQMLRFQLDEIFHRFIDDTAKKIRKEYGNKCSTFSTQIQLHYVRLFITRLLNYLIHGVLLSKSADFLRGLHCETSPHGLMKRQQHMLQQIMRAFFISSNASDVNEAIFNCFQKAREFINAVEDFCDVIDKSKGSTENDENIVLNLPYSINTDRRGSGDDDKLATQRYQIANTSAQFKRSTSQLQSVLMQCIENGSNKKQSMHWCKVYFLLFDC